MDEFFGIEALVERGIEPRGIIHVGAHYGEEAEHYSEYVGENVVWIEAHPEYAEKLKEAVAPYGHVAHEACLSDTSDVEVKFFVTADEYASSLLVPAVHQELHPHAQLTGSIKVMTITYSDLVALLSQEDRAKHESANILVLDVQGAELMVMDSMGDRLYEFDAIVTEYSTVNLYEGGARLHQLDEKLGSHYTRVIPGPGEHPAIVADALYVRSK